MTAFNFRSLLLAAIVLSNCITWTASRHHYAHNVHQHRTRHRRQGAGLYLPASYVIPEGEGGGPWGEWGEVSPCSRTCGGGVASQKRICLQPGPEGQSQCTGGDTKYFSCQTQDCPDGSGDFRAEQCAEFNDKAFRGVKYNWVPYTKAPNPCELNCMPHGDRFYLRHKLQVTDGTRCTDESFDVCVNGRCQPVGCDMMLNSTAREDKCRECRGTGANCRTTEGKFDSQDLMKGYNDILLIPAGSTNINIAEVVPSNNYLALRAKNGTYYLNGDYHIDFPRTIMIAGSLWTYERSQLGFAAPDKLRCLGPTTEPLYLSLLLQDENVGIRYEYSVPNNSAPPTDKRYNWAHEEFTPCSATCGGGFQTRNVTCRSRDELEMVDDSLCDEGLKPPTNQSCSPDPCPAQWVEGPWGECSQKCGSGGVRSREVNCQKIIANGIKSIVPDKECFDLLGPKPEVFQKCNEDAPCPTWFVGHWRPCDKLCDEGKQKRQVVCFQNKTGRIEVLDDENCIEEKPKAEQLCMLEPCDGTDWVTTRWSGCDTCTSKFRTRIVTCTTKGRIVLNEAFCSYHNRPVDREECEPDKLPACEVQWYATQWSKCSVNCGDGVQTRRVFCGVYNNDKSGEGVEKVEDAKCANLTKYKDTKPCTVPKEECPSQWFAGPWTECTEKCGGGEQYRRVMCFRGDEEATNCDGPTVLESTQLCNKGPCNTDLLLPVSRNLTVVMDDGMDYCDDEDYEEAGLDSTGDMMSDSTVSSLSTDYLITEGSGFSTTDTTDSDYTTDSTTGSSETSVSTDVPSTVNSTTDESTPTTVKPLKTSYAELESTLESGSGYGSSLSTDYLITEGSGFSTTDTTDSDYTTDGETGSSETSISTDVPSTVNKTTDKSTTTTVEPPKRSYAELESTLESGSGYGSSLSTDYLITEGSGFSTTDTTDSDYTTDSTTGSSETSISTDVPSTVNSTTDESTPTTVKPPKTSAGLETESTGTEETESTEISASTVAEEIGSTDEADSTSSGETTLTGETISTDTDKTVSTVSGGTDETHSTDITVTKITGPTETTVTEKTESTESTVTEETGSTETTITNAAASIITSESDSTETEITNTGSTNTKETSDTEQTSTGSTEKAKSTESTITEETGSTESTVKDKTESTITSESDSTGTETTNTGDLTSTGKTSDTVETSTGSTEENKSTELKVTEKTISTESTVTEETESTKSTVMDVTESTITSQSDSKGTETTNASSANTEETSDTKETSTESTDSTTTTKETSDTEETSTGSTDSTTTMLSVPTGSTTTTRGVPTGSTTTTRGVPPAKSSSTEESSTQQSTDSSEATEASMESSESSGSDETTESGTTISAVSSSLGAESSTLSETKSTTEAIESSSSASGSTGAESSTPSETESTTEAIESSSSDSESTGAESSTPSKTESTTEAIESSSSASGSTGAESSTPSETESTTEAIESSSSASESTGTESSTPSKTESTTEAIESSSSASGSTGAESSTSSETESTTEAIESSSSASGSTGAESSTSSETESTTEAIESSSSTSGSTGAENSTTSEYESTTNTTEPGSSVGSDSTTEESGSSTVETSTVSEEITTETMGSTGSGESTFTTYSTTEATTIEGSTEESEGTVTELSTTEGTTPSTITSWSPPMFGPGVCKPRRKSNNCTTTKFGCCPDRKSPASGPFDEGCAKPRTCKESTYHCCPDGLSPAQGNNNEGCPVEPCADTLFGCCISDNKTAAEGNDQEGCPPPPPPCASSKYHCCADNETEATGPEKEGCPETETSTTEVLTETTTETTESIKTSEGSTTNEGTTDVISTSTVDPCSGFAFGCCADNETEAFGPDGQGCPCNATEFGCCPDDVSPASGLSNEGCPGPCSTSPHGCCQDNKTPAHGPDFEGCCLLQAFGCCPDNRKPAEGPHLEGCGCHYALHGCCPDNVTVAQGPDNQGCGCKYTQHGCCPDRNTAAAGPNNEGCSCKTYQFGCCADGVTIAVGPEQQGCYCYQSKFGCCGDGETHATGPDAAGCDCSSSLHGCCPDGRTDAVGPKFLGCTDVPENKQAACSMSTDPGPCHNFTAMWYYDVVYGGCSRFWYGGCDGNGNRFGTKEECEDVCVQPSSKDACKLPGVKGICDANYQRWHYNSTREQCIPFRYGGCLGNANNFDTRELCQKQCEPSSDADQCNLPIDQGSCSGNYSRWGFNSETHQCQQFIWGGCEGNSNRFSSEAACQMRCAGTQPPQCTQPQEAGNCSEKEALWSFSQSENRCLPFYYSGCGGNDNRFRSRETCEQTCPSAYVPDKCTLPAATGQCSNYRERWFYDTSFKRCRQFPYGGCGGNENNFGTEAECESSCSEIKTTTTTTTTTTLRPTEPQPQPRTERPEQKPAAPERPEFCFNAIDAGPCNNTENRYAYDTELGRCVAFQYGGCGGNQNNFPDEAYCSLYCHPMQDICQLPMLQGPCKDSLMRWFYDPYTDSCSQFTYGGCEGNDNRFESLETCENRCRTGPAPVAPTTPTTTVIVHGPSECRVPESLEECRYGGLVWYFDPSQHECVHHANQEAGAVCRHTGTFLSQEACERSCGAFRGVDVCKQRKDPGPCQNYTSKVYFDPSTGQCHEFVYGGCLGGANRFSSIEECLQVCKAEIADPCTLPPEEGNCYSYIQQWYYDPSRDQCDQFVFTGCSGNENRFETQRDCEARCKRPIQIVTTLATPKQQLAEPECKTPSSLAPCGNNVTVFYYDSESGQCLVSGIGGCGHPNTFTSEEECERRCGAFRGIDVCGAHLDPGPCRKPISKIYWDAITGTCQPYAYSGCAGGPNRFSSVEECMNVCGDTGPASACRQEVQSGHNCAAVPTARWHYSVVHVDCVVFVYLGCGGNDNNFHSYAHCADVCRVSRTKDDDPNQVLLPDCTPYRQECETLTDCQYGIDRLTQNGCDRCVCRGDPCIRANCPLNEQCIAIAMRDSVSGELVYSAKCVAGEPSAPQPITPPEPNVAVSEGDTATLRCLFHSNPPPKITWRKGELTIDGNVDRYRLMSDGALQIVSVYRNDTGVYICVADNGLGVATQEINLVVNDPNQVLLPDCTPYHQECETLNCQYGIDRLTQNGCDRCVCREDPCVRANCPWNERCEAFAMRDSVSQEPVYSARCVAESNDVYDCDEYVANCSRLRCEYGIQRTRLLDGCEKCSCIQVEIDCEPLKQECNQLRCNFGIERIIGSDGCERCKCNEQPCKRKSCGAGERCVVQPNINIIDVVTELTAECRPIVKAGTCPMDETTTNEVNCRHECADDADCRGVGKCCRRGCSDICLVPVEPTSPHPLTTTIAPNVSSAPQVLPPPKPEVVASEGGTATLRCLFQGNPPPKITWRFGEFTIDSNAHHYRLMSDGSLEIVSVYRNDTGVYICVADNGLGVATQEIHLVVNDPVRMPVGIAGDENAVVIGELGRPLHVRCLAYGYPPPSVFWYHGYEGTMVPYNDAVYEARGNVLLIRSLAIDILGQYTCQAYNGEGKAASWVILVQAYMPDGHENIEHEFLVPRDPVASRPGPQLPITAETTTTTTSTTTEAPRPYFTVPVGAHVSTKFSTLNIGNDLRLTCEVDGFPEPEVYWTKDGANIQTDDRITITGSSVVSRLTVTRVSVADSGLYACHASNQHSSQSDTAQINVQQLVVPAKCTDNPFFADCALIVRSKFCRHKYYSQFCCKSCVEAGQLDSKQAELQADQPLRKK